jgi:hypothetical protein
MISLWSLLFLTHLVGLALGVGAATVKLTFVLKCVRDYRFAAVYIQVAKPITRLIVVGLVLLTLSGIGWLWSGVPLTRLLTAKLLLVAALWAVGPFIDRVVEPRFRELIPTLGDEPTLAFTRALKRYVTFEAIGTGLFYVITVMGSRI